MIENYYFIDRIKKEARGKKSEIIYFIEERRQKKKYFCDKL